MINTAVPVQQKVKPLQRRMRRLSMPLSSSIQCTGTPAADKSGIVYVDPRAADEKKDKKKKRKNRKNTPERSHTYDTSEDVAYYSSSSDDDDDDECETDCTSSAKFGSTASFTSPEKSPPRMPRRRTSVEVKDDFGGDVSIDTHPSLLELGWRAQASPNPPRLPTRKSARLDCAVSECISNSNDYKGEQDQDDGGTDAFDEASFNARAIISLSQNRQPGKSCPLSPPSPYRPFHSRFQGNKNQDGDCHPRVRNSASAIPKNLVQRAAFLVNNKC